MVKISKKFRKQKSKRFQVISVISMLVTLAVVTILAVSNIEKVYRYVQMGRLCDPDIKKREVALNYLIRHVADDPVVQAGAREALNTKDDECFEQIVGAIAIAGVWGPDYVPHWTRYQILRSRSKLVEIRKTSMAELARLRWLNLGEIDAKQFEGIIKDRLADEDEGVRYNALLAAAMIDDQAVREKLLLEGLKDEQQVIVEHAWYFLSLTREGWLDEAEQYFERSVGYAKAASLYAMIEAGYGGVQKYIQHVIANGDKDEAAYKLLPYLTGGLSSARLDAVQSKWLGGALNARDQASYVLGWRALIGRRGDDAMGQQVSDELFGKEKSFDAIAAAGISRGYWKQNPVIQKMLKENPDGLFTDSDERRLRELVLFEALPDKVAAIKIVDEMPYLIRLHAVRASTISKPEDLMVLFKAEQPTMSDLAVHVALKRFSKEECLKLAKGLITSFNDKQRAAGAMLAAFSGPDEKMIDLLHNRFVNIEEWAIQQHFGMALHYLKEPVVAPEPATLLVRVDIPRTTTTMLLLRQGDLKGLDWLISPVGASPVNLSFLFDVLRFYPIVKYHIPELPRFDAYGDPELQKFQVKIIRDWYLVNRNKLKYNAETHQYWLEGSEGKE